MDDCTLEYFGSYAVKEKKDANMVSMAAGLFNIPKQVLLRKLPSILRMHENVSLVHLLPNDSHCILFFDVDHASDVSNIEHTMKNYLVSTFELPLAIDDIEIFFTKNQSYKKYHVYVPQIIVTKATLLRVTNDLNDIFQMEQASDQPMFDIAVCTGTAMKLDGFEKYNNKTKQYAPNTRYLPMNHCECSNSEMWAKTYLPADGPLTSVRGSCLDTDIDSDND